jgi:hypothetical protein
MIGNRVSGRSTNRGDSLSARRKCLALEGDLTDEGTKAVRARASAGRTRRLGAVPTLRDQPQDGPQVAGALLRRGRCRSEGARGPVPTSACSPARRAELAGRDPYGQRPSLRLGQLPPADFHETSRRPLPVPIWGRDSAYPETFEGVRTNKEETVRWCGRMLFLSSALRHELLGLDPIETDTWEVYFGSVHLGRIERPSGGRFRLRFVRYS